MKAFLKRRLKRLQELRHRIENFRHWRSKGLTLGRAWEKADLTF